MSDTASRSPFAKASAGDDRNLAFVVYALFFVAPFMVWFTAVIGVVIAYVRRLDAPAVERTHYNYQIRTFWVAVIIAAVAALSAVLALFFGLGDVYRLVTRADGFDGWDINAWQSSSLDVGELTIHPMTIICAVVFVVGSIIASLWMMIASIFGLARLAGSAPIGRLP